MKTGLWITLGVLVAVGLAVTGLLALWLVEGRLVWRENVVYGQSEVPVRGGDLLTPGACGSGMMGRPMMGGPWAPAAPGGPIGCQGYLPGPSATFSGTLGLEEARDQVQRYLADLDYRNLAVAEVMEFEQNFYALVREAKSGIGAMELLVDKTTGAVRPEPGPNMMWNGKYGMHAWMMGGVSQSNIVAPEEVQEIAQRWLDKYRPGTVVEDIDPFYGYYTVHTLKDGQIEGMLSVHGTTGQVWYHSWHGAFIGELEE